ncbi:hypothetical protein MHU86_7155 [Fragilaria crotonensis]|nr:hypothetical protein MHU86_7155 [Fragilaria crotonensis]
MTDVIPVLSTTVRGDEVSTTNDDILIEDVLKGNEEEYLLNAIMKLVDGAEDDPPVMFAWKNVYVFVQAIHEAQAQAAAPGGVPLPPDPLGLPAAVTEEIFKEAVLEYARVQRSSSTSWHHVSSMLSRAVRWSGAFALSA